MMSVGEIYIAHRSMSGFMELHIELQGKTGPFSRTAIVDVLVKAFGVRGEDDFRLVFQRIRGDENTLIQPGDLSVIDASITAFVHILINYTNLNTGQVLSPTENLVLASKLLSSI